MMDEQTKTKIQSSGQSQAMRWISFIIISVLFVFSAIKAILGDRETDRILAGLFLIITGFAWGANIWKFLIEKIKP